MIGDEDQPHSSSAAFSGTTAEKFAHHLMESVEKFHLNAKHRQSPVHIVKALSAMEIGGVAGSSRSDYDIVRALIRSATRKYMPYETFRVRGLATYSDRCLVMPMSNQFVAMDALNTISISGLDFTEKIISTLVISSQPPRADGQVPTALLLVLSNLGRLRFCDLRIGECLHTFQLPIRRFKFKHIHWNKAYSEVWLLGRAVLPGCENGSERTGASPSIAVFEIQPARFKALLQLDKNLFQNVYAAGLEDDVLVTFNTSPHSCALYSFDEIYREHCIRVYDPVTDSGQNEPVAFNVKLNKTPNKLLDIKGDFSGVYFGGCCKVVLCEPQTFRQDYVLHEISTNETPFLHDMRLLGPQQGVAITIDCSTMMLCKDDSSNFLRFEGVHLACYEVSSLISDPKHSEVRVRWRTALLPMRRSETDGQWITGPSRRESVSTRFGRVSRAVNVNVMDSVPLRIIKSSYDGGSDLIHLLTLYDIANVDSCSTVGAEPDPDWITLVISIRGVSGEIYKITPVRKVDIDALKKVNLVGEDEILVLTCYDGRNTIAEMYCLREEDAKKWQAEIIKEMPFSEYTPKVLSHKQKRKTRAATH
ncbi:unnamed protein product [Cylicocyclus nassatus]|uniref:Uncharacterized protein n=1 Tax=Cylicocyclus nassatus TaxID=53992 RepID=A0AA36MFE4_CYLNA|nr:unnamed protein product [Cylicocyclus nassatus]